jgi:hypothetical protein
MKWEMPERSPGSEREPERTQTPRATERTASSRSLAMRRPLGSSVTRKASVVYLPPLSCFPRAA